MSKARNLSTLLAADGQIEDSRIDSVAASKLSGTISDARLSATKQTAKLEKTGGAITGAITTSSTFDGRDVGTDGTKLDTVESNATADQTKADIDSLGINATQVSGFTVGKSVPSGAVFTDTNTVYTHPSNHPISTVTGLQAALDDRYTESETDSKIVELSPPATKSHVESLGILASSITGALPTIDGSALTGVSPTKSTVDALGINATHVSGFTVGKSVPAGALFTDTEVTTSLSHNAATRILAYVDETGTTTSINLTQYIDDTNLSRITSGTLAAATGIATFTRDDSSTFTIDMSSLIDTDTTYSVGDGGLTQKNFTTALNTKLGAIEASATADQTKADIDALGINATHVSGFTVGVSVPAAAVFTDTNTVYTHPANHAISVTTGLQAALDGKVDDSQVLTNVPSGAVFTDTNTVYTHPTNHAISVTTGLQAALDGKVDDSQVLTNVPSGALFTDTNTTYSVGDGGLTTNDFTAADHTKLNSIATDANDYNHPTNHAISVTTGLQAALDGKVDDSQVLTNVPSGAVFTDTNTVYTHPANHAISVTTGLQAALDGKVDDSQVLTNVPSGALFTDTNTVYSHPSTHSIAEVSGLQTALNGKVDDSQVLTNVPSGAVFTDTNTVYSHPSNHAISVITGLSTALAGKVDDSQVLTNVPSGAVFTDTETTTSISHNGSTKTLSYVDETGTTTNIDLTAYVDDTNLARLTSGSLAASGMATFTRDDSTTFTIDMSDLLDTDTNTWRTVTDSTSTTSSTVGASATAVKAAYDRTWPDTNTHRGIDDTPVNGQTGESISSNWAFDHAASSTGHPRDTRNQVAGTYNNYSHPTGAGNNHVPTGGSSGQFLKYSSSGVATWATPSYTTNTDTNTHRGIDNTPVNGQTAESISSNWAFDHAASSTGHPRDTRSQVAGSYSASSHTHSYLPLTGGTVTGDTIIDSASGWNAGAGMLNVGGAGDGRIQVRHIWGKSSTTSGTDHLWLQHANTGKHVQIGNSGGGNNLYVSGEIRAGGYYGGNVVWHTGNDASGSGLDADLLDGQQGSYYSPTTHQHDSRYVRLSGGTLTGALTGTTGTFVADTNALFIKSSTNGTGVEIAMTDATGAAQIGYMRYFHGDSVSYGSGNSIILTGSEASMTILADGKLMYKEGIYLKPASGTGAGTRKDTNWDTAYGWGNHASNSYITNTANYNVTQRIRFSGNQTNNWDTIATGTGSQGSIEIYNTGVGNDAFISFHAGGDYAGYFGLDADTNDLAWGGWSVGAVKHKIWHAGNDGTGSGLDADLLDGQQGSYYAPAANTIANASQSHYVSGNAFATSGAPSSVLEYAQASGITDTKVAPSSDWHNSIRMGHGDPYTYYSNTLAIRMTGSGPGDIYTQTVSSGNAGGWKKHWNTANDGAGSGLDADTLDGSQAAAFTRYFEATSAPGTTTNGTMWLDTSDDTLYQRQDGSWVQISTSNVPAVLIYNSAGTLIN